MFKLVSAHNIKISLFLKRNVEFVLTHNGENPCKCEPSDAGIWSERNQRSTCTSKMAKRYSRAKCVMLYLIRMIIESNKCAFTVANDRLSVNCIRQCSNSTKSKDTCSDTQVKTI